ncbi:MAG: glycoside hydrolase family 95 protein, partial [Bacteroidetes bacterium]
MRSFYLFWVSLCLLTTVGAQEAPVLWYEQPAADWNQALPVGNGRLGAMVFGGYAREHIQLNEESLWAGCPTRPDADARAHLPAIQQALLEGRIEEALALSEEHLRSDPLRIRSYQPLGDVFIDFVDHKFYLPQPRPLPVAGYRRALDLATGLATTTYTLDGVTVHREIFASAPDDVIAIRLFSEQPGGLTFRFSLSREQDARVEPVGEQELVMTGQLVDLPGPDMGPAGLHMKFAARVRAQVAGGRLQAVNNSFFVQEADTATFYLTAATDYRPETLDFDPNIDPAGRCAEILDRLAGRAYSVIRAAHVADHQAMFNRVSLDLGGEDRSHLPTDRRLQAVKDGDEDPGLAVLQFQLGRYLLMGSSRAPGRLPANLQGIWNDRYAAAWNADFHTNINLQMNYWPAEVTNLSETFLPFSDLVERLRVPGRETARLTYGAEGWTMNHLTDVFGHTAISDGIGWGTFPMAGPWLVLHQWEHFLFTRDHRYLEEAAYPSMKESAEFVLSFLIRDEKGQWVTAPSNSPENTYRLPDGSQYKFTYGATMDIQIIRELLTACLAAEAELGHPNPGFAARCQAVLADLPPTKVSARYGTIQEWIEDYEEADPGHRHMSHLFGLHPGSQITPDTPELFEAAKNTIARRME